MAEPTNEPKLTERAVRLHRPQPGIEAVRARELMAAFGSVGLVRLERSDRAVIGRGVRPALAHDLGGDALSDLADHPAVAGQEGLARMALDINEPRADDQPLRVDSLFRRSPRSAGPQA